MRTTVKHLLLILLFAVLFPADVWAKRAAPHPVKPVFQGENRFKQQALAVPGKSLLPKNANARRKYLPSMK